MNRARVTSMILVLLIAAPVLSQETAWDVYEKANPGSLERGEVGPLQARLMDALTPEQAEAFAAGADPASIVLEDGSSLVDLFAVLMTGGQGLVYVPLDSCVALQTASSVAGAMAADESRNFLIRGVTTDLSGQGGSATGCGVPAEAVAVAMHFRTFVIEAGLEARLRVRAATSPFSLNLTDEYLRQGDLGKWNLGTTLVTLCEGTCSSGDLEVQTALAAAHVLGQVIGYFRAIEVADVPHGSGSGLDADTLDALDSTAFSPLSHTHGGSAIVSGTVTEPFIDPLIARDGEIMTTVLLNDGSGSTLDADLLDGLDSLDLMLQTGNRLTVSPSCPVAALDALAARCWQTITLALAEIGAGLPAASATNRYVVEIGPGIYPEQVTMIQFVDIEGAGEASTTITNTASPTLAGASNAALKSLTVENTDGGTAIQNSAVSPMIMSVTARATGAGAPVAVKNGMGAAPNLTHVTTVSDGDGVENVGGGTVTVRDSTLSGATNGIENGGGTASIVNTQIVNGASDGATGTTFTCLGAYDGTFTELDGNCQ